MHRLFFLLVFILSACSKSPQETFAQGCKKMALAETRMDRIDRDFYCQCLQIETAALSQADKKALGVLMEAFTDGSSFRQSVENAHDNAQLSRGAGQDFFRATLSCSVRLVR